MIPVADVLAGLREEGSGLSRNAAELIEAGRISADRLRELATDSFDVLNWARRLGFNRDRQIDELVRTFEVRLGYRPAVLPSNPCGTAPAAHLMSEVQRKCAEAIAKGED